MTEGHALVLVAAALYVLECVQWHPGPVVVVRRSGDDSSRLAGSSPLLTQAGGVLMVADPLPPLGGLMFAQDWPVALSPRSAIALGAEHGIESRLPDRPTQPPGPRLPRIGHGSCEHISAHWAGVVRDLATLASEERAGRIRNELRHRLDADEVRRRIKDLQAHSGPLRRACSGLFYYVFVGVPVALLWFGLAAAWRPILAALLLGMVTVAVLAYLLGRRTSRGWAGVIPTLLTPLGAIRATDHFWRHVACTFHPLALVNAACTDVDARTFSAAYLRLLRYPPPQAGPPEETLEWFRQEALAACEAAVRRAGHDPGRLLEAPVPDSADATAFCPRCLQQYSRGSVLCQDCGGLPLQHFQEPSPAAEPRV